MGERETPVRGTVAATPKLAPERRRTTQQQADAAEGSNEAAPEERPARSRRGGRGRRSAAGQEQDAAEPQDRAGGVELIVSASSAQPSPLVVAIVGAGPAGIYAAEALSQQTDVAVEVAVIDRLPVPFGLVRYGVAPDHHSIRSIRNTLERTLEKPNVRFYGDVAIGSDLSITELRESVDAVIYAYGAGTDRRLEIPGEHLPGSIAAAELVAWYCGHPDVHPDTDQPSITDHLVAARDR